MAYVFVFLILFLTSPTYAYNFTPSSAPQQSKIATRWSLAQWMEQKGRLQWMDLWLNSNTKSPSFYEIYLGGDSAQYESSTRIDGGTAAPTSDLGAWRAHAGMFVSLIGVFGQFEKSDKEDREVIDAVAQLRLLGQNDQGSNLTGFYGLHQIEGPDDSVKLQQAGGYLTLYIFDFWALQGRYQHYFENDSKLGFKVDGHRVEGTTWVEWGALRLYGTYFKEPLRYTRAADSSTEITREGFHLGIRVYLDFKK